MLLRAGAGLAIGAGVAGADLVAGAGVPGAASAIGDAANSRLPTISGKSSSWIELFIANSGSMSG
jgi:hypothetical protein